MQHREDLRPEELANSLYTAASVTPMAEARVRAALQKIRQASPLRFTHAFTLWTLLVNSGSGGSMPLSKSDYADFIENGWTRAQVNQAVDDLVDAGIAKISYLEGSTTLVVTLSSSPDRTLCD